MTGITSVSPISAISSATNGMAAAERRLDASASRIAGIGSDKQDAKSVDPAAETVAQSAAREAFAANAAVLRVSSSMKRALDIAV